MRQVKTKQVRRMCAVKGCGNRLTYFISRTGDFAGSINICPDCISAAAKLICVTEPGVSEKNEKVQNASEPTAEESVLTGVADVVSEKAMQKQAEAPKAAKKRTAKPKDESAGE